MTKRADIFRAVLWMSGAVVSFIAMAIAGRSLAARYDTFEIMMWRSVIGLIIVSVVLSVGGRWSKVTPHRLGLHILRNLMHFIGQNLWFFAVTMIPIAQVFALEFTSPLWVLVLSPLVLGEKMTRIRVIAALLGFCGILLVTRPGTEAISPGVIAAALCAICFACTHVATKRLTRDVSTICILFWLTAIQLVFGVITAGWDLQITLPDPATAPLLILVGCAGLLAHFCVTTALSFAPATVVVPIDFTRLPLAAVIGALFLAQPLDPWILVGAVVIFAGNYINIRSETRPVAGQDSKPV